MLSTVRMALDWLRWDRLALALICLTLGASTGLAAAVPGAVPAVTGHTAFVTSIRLVDAPEEPKAALLEYGLATYRDIRMFGLWEVEHAVRAAQDRMVFVWSASAGDPRDASLVQPTGDFARVRDQNGIVWTVYEFTYLDGAAVRHTYGVRVGDLQTADDPELGRDGQYNYVLVYRSDRLLGPPVLQKARAAAPVPDPVADGTADATEALPDEVLDLAPDFGTHAVETEADGSPKLAFGMGKVPRALEHNDPALPLPRDVAPLPRH